MQDTRDSLSRGLGFQSSSELDLPERMRSQRKGAPAPPRLSQDPLAISIEDELRPYQATTPKSDSAFARLGRAFRRKSKTGNDIRVDLGSNRKDVPPVPKTPRSMSSQALLAQRSDRLTAAKATSIGSLTTDTAPQKSKDSIEVNGKWREVAGASIEVPPREGSSAGEKSSKVLGHLSSQRDVADAKDDRLKAHADTTARAASMKRQDSDRNNSEEERLALQHERTLPALPQKDDQAGSRSESGTQNGPANAVKLPLPADSVSGGERSEAAASSPSSDPDPSERPTSAGSTTSNLRSMAFLASAISMGATADETKEESAHIGKSDDDVRQTKKDTPGASDTFKSEVYRTDSDSSMPKRSLSTEQTEPTFVAMSRGSNSASRRLEPKSATRNDQVPSILSDFLSMDADMSAKGAKGGKARALSRLSDENRSIGDMSNDDSSSGLQHPTSAMSQATKGVRAVSEGVQSGTRRGSASLADPGAVADHAPEMSASEEARKVKSFGNLRAPSNDAGKEARLRSGTSRLASSSALPNVNAGQSKDVSADTATPSVLNGSRDDGVVKSQSVSQRLLQRPKTSGAEVGLGNERSTLTSPNAAETTNARRGSGPMRASLDQSSITAKPHSSSPTEAGLEMLASRDQPSTPTQPRAAGERERKNSIADSAHVLTSERRQSSGLGRRPSEHSIGAITPSSSRIESRGGAAALFGNPTTRPRTSSLLPSFGFNRSRNGSSAGLEGSGKSPGTFGSGTRSTSGGFLREPGDPLTPSTLQPDAISRSPRTSSSSRPSFSRQLSAATILSDAESTQPSIKQEKKFKLSAFLPYDDEDASEYAERIASTAPKTQIAAILASSADEFYVEALYHFMTRFWFNGLPLDIALRKLLMDLHLPKETQQIDRVMEAFARRYNECNNGLFASDDQPYILAFSLMMLHTDAFNKNAKNKMTKVDYLRNTGASGVPTELLEYLYDNLTFTQFIYIEDEEGGRRRPSEASAISMGGTGMSSSSLAAQGTNANNRTKLDPYFLIAQGRLTELRPDLDDTIPEDTPFSYTGSLPTFDVDRLNSSFLHAPSIEILTTKPTGEQPGMGNPAADEVEEEVVSLKVTKVGIVNRKDDMSDGGKKSASRKWKTSGLLLTGSQLLLFKDVVWINALQSQILDQVGHSLHCNDIPTDDDAADEVVEGGVVISPRITYFRPDGVISLADAVAVKDQAYGKYDFVFRLLAAKGRQYLVQAQSEDDMNDWIHKINFCASFRTSNIKIRGLDLAPRVGSGRGSQDLESQDSRFARSAASRPSFSDADRALRGLDVPGSGRSTPIPDDVGDHSKDESQRLSVDPISRRSESEAPPRPRSSASHRTSPASSALQKRAKARRELMLTKIAETEAQLERAKSRLADEIRLARHFAILTPFLKSTRDRIEMSALPLADRIRALRLDVAKTEARCKILRLDLAAGERVARALLPNAYLSPSVLHAASRMPSAQIGTPQLMELGSVSSSQSQFEELFAPLGADSTAAVSSGTVTKPASRQRNQMNLNAVSEQPADESPVMRSGRKLPETDADDAEQQRDVEHGGDTHKTSAGVANASQGRRQSAASLSSAENREVEQHDMRRKTRGVEGSAADEVPEDWDQTQVARPGTNRISLVNLPSPDELEEATGGRFRFDRGSAE